VSDIEQQLLRLRASTREMMREELELSPHRSLSALADELIESAIKARRDARFRAGERDDG
jgi:hypothetical protein